MQFLRHKQCTGKLALKFGYLKVKYTVREIYLPTWAYPVQPQAARNQQVHEEKNPVEEEKDDN
jgi:hypothetical protein